jgi:hypothetical protein
MRGEGESAEVIAGDETARIVTGIVATGATANGGALNCTGGGPSASGCCGAAAAAAAV